MKEIDWSSYEADEGLPRLGPGRYVARIDDAEIVETARGGHRVKMTLIATKGGHGQMTGSVNVNVPSSEKATEIGRKQFFTLVTHAGHPDPKNMGRVGEALKVITGNEVGINVVADNYVDRDGNPRTGVTLDSYHPFFNPDKADSLGAEPPLAETETRAPRKGGDDFEDEIPF